jgi:hypothetical protein
MANPQKGEVEFEIGGKTYTYFLGTYGLAKLEQNCGGKPWPAIFQEATANGWGFHILLTCFRCGLLLHHEPMTEKEASILLDQMTAPVFMARLADIWKMQFGDSGGSDSRPTNAATINGSGISSPAVG